MTDRDFSSPKSPGISPDREAAAFLSSLLALNTAIEKSQGGGPAQPAPQFAPVRVRPVRGRARGGSHGSGRPLQGGTGERETR
ncbi:MAG: hypothetical protein JST11_29985 [Acidobacteria bacterium]|nr:hypothetical protein [Acidobacteriota bacterium]